MSDAHEDQDVRQGYGSDLPPGNWSKYKFPPERVALDDFEVTSPAGATIYPHRGESFWALPYANERQLSEAGIDYFHGIETSDDEQRDDSFERVKRHLAKIVVDWDITDNENRRYDAPTKVEAWADIPTQLFWHIWRKVQGVEDAPKDKRGSRRSRRGSSTQRSG